MLNEKSYGFVLWGVPRFHRAEVMPRMRNATSVWAEDRRAAPCNQAMNTPMSQLKAVEYAKVEACLSAS